MKDSEEIKMIYNHLVDDESKEIFLNRLLFYITNDKRYIKKVIDYMPHKKEIDALIAFCKEIKNTLVVYGAGLFLEILEEFYTDFHVNIICDMDKKKQLCGWHGIKVISPELLFQDYKDSYVLVTPAIPNQIIEQELLGNGFKQSQILNVGKIFDIAIKKQYFDSEILSPCINEVFVDAGGFDGLSTETYINWSKGSYKKIYVFEPDSKNFELCKRRIGALNNRIEILNVGLWHKSEEKILQNQGGGSKIIENNAKMIIDNELGEKIRTSSLDEIVYNEKITFIKMDIEGAELMALKGASKLIKKLHPRLAVCIYHKPEDIIEIPAFLLSIYNEYQFYLRHYHLCEQETVLYAV